MSQATPTIARILARILICVNQRVARTYRNGGLEARQVRAAGAQEGTASLRDVAKVDVGGGDLDQDLATGKGTGLALLTQRDPWPQRVAQRGHGNSTRRAAWPQLRRLVSGHLCEPAVVALERHGHNGGRTISVLGHDQVSLARSRRLPLIGVLAVQ